MSAGKSIPGEGRGYREHRNRLLRAEIELKDQRERVAALRRELPLGARVQVDYVFREGPRDLQESSPGKFFETRLSELFQYGKDCLIVDHLMFAPDWEMACPMCSMWADGLDAIAPHVWHRANFVLVARAELSNLRGWGRRRGWKNLRLLSSRDNTFNRDFHTEIDDSQQLPAVSVFCRQPNGDIHHFYTTEASLEQRHHRAMDLFTPVWNLFDLLPGGRGNWMPEHSKD